MKWDKISEEVFYPRQNEFVEISKNDIDSLIKAAEDNPRQRARYCTHSSTEDDVHEMVIYHKKGTYIRPHKHLGKTESFLLISGEADVLIFDEDGNLLEARNMGKYETGKNYYYRIPDSCFHAQIFRKDTIFHEATKGPFDVNSTINAIWAPKETEYHLVKDYMKNLESQLKLLLK